MLTYNATKISFFLCLAAFIVGCTPRIDIRGNLPTNELLSEITTGDQSRQQVEEILGTPSSVTMFDQEKCTQKI